MKIYILSQSADSEGRSSHDVAAFLDDAVARAVGATGWKDRSMGPPGSGAHVRAMHVYESAQEFYEHESSADPGHYIGPGAVDIKQVLRTRALDKLTPEERLLLGLV